MDSVRSTVEKNPLELAKRGPVKGSGFNSAFKLTQADNLLRETGQYPCWQTLRQKNVAEAVKIADAVVKRHEILVSAQKGDPIDWKAFDRLTQYAADRGINLYKSHDLFKSDIVPDPPKTLPEIPSNPKACDPAMKMPPALPQTGPKNTAPPSFVSDNGSILIDDNLLVLNVTYNNHILNSGMAGYAKSGNVFLPLDEISRTLDFNVNVDPEKGKAQGWFISEERKFSLDLNKGQIVADGRNYPVTEAHIVAGDDDIFIDSKLMGDLFPVDFKTNFSEMSLEIAPREKIPFQERLDREAMWNRINPYAESQAELPRKESEYKLFSPPFVDFTLRSDYSKSDRNSSFQGGYSILSKGDLGKMSSEIFISGDDENKLQNVRVSLERNDPEAGLLGPLNATQFAIGDITTPSFPIIGGMRSESGLSVSNMALDRSREFDITSFHGNLSPGWDVELYRNDILIETHRSGSDGRYRFEDVPVYFGSNDFKLVFYGPQGQKRVETEQVTVGDQMLKKGEGVYQFSVSKKKDELLDPGNKPRQEDQGTLKAVVRYETGISKNLSLTGGVSSEEIDSRRHNYLNAGVRGSFADFSLNSDYIHDTAGGDAVQFIGQTRIGPVNLRAKQAFFNDFTDPGDDLDAKTSLTDISLNGTISGNKTLSSVPFSLTWRDTQRQASHEKKLGLRLSENFKNLNLNQYLEIKDDSASGKDSPEIEGYIQGISQIGPLRTRGIINYDIQPDTEISGVGLSNFLRLNDRLSSELILNHEFKDTDTSSARLKMNWNTGKFILSPEVYADTNGDYGGLLSFNMSLGREPRTGRIKTSSESLADTGGVSARVFRDKNLNGVFDKEDEPIEGARVNALQSHKSAQTNGEGIAFLTGLQKNKPTDVALDTDSLEDPFQEPLAKGNSILPRPGHVDLMEIPVVTTGEVDGTVFKEGKNGNRTPLANRTIQLLDPEGKVVEEVKSEYDGFYLFMKVKPGTYTIKVKQDDKPDKGYVASASDGSAIAPVKIGNDGTVASGNDIIFKLPGKTKIVSAVTAADNKLADSTGTKEQTEPAPRAAKGTAEYGTVEKSKSASPVEAKSKIPDTMQKYGIHLTSYRSAEKAVKGISALRNSYKTLLGKSAFSVKTIDLGPGKGKWYRVIAGSFNSVEEAKNMGRRIKLQSPYCRVVSTGDHTGVHLTSFRTKTKATESIKELRAHYPDILGKVSFSIKDVDLGTEKGKWKRVIAGRFENRETAHALAERIKLHKPYIMPVDVEKKSSTSIHLASFRTSGKADQALENINKKFPGIVEEHSLFIRPVNLGAKGIWYRVMAGSFENRQEADNIIKHLSSQNQYAAPVKLF
nr:SPOR domain-containing protein [uncultured Desulfobacter sp.]